MRREIQMGLKSPYGIQDFYRISERVGTAGQPTPAQVESLGECGYEVVINLRPSSDCLPSERRLVEAQGLEYVHIPVDWENPAEEDVTAFFEAMTARTGKRIFVHCARNMRVSAFIYLYRVKVEGAQPEIAQDDLYRIWAPNETWLRLIERVLTKPM
jgi:protein tyrosine phosphatase (PTP) superfamily phosphohydrolase (DUF442 family)